MPGPQVWLYITLWGPRGYLGHASVGRRSANSFADRPGA